MGKKVLHLSVSKQWFDMIKSGEKTEEYREIKDYWRRRLFDMVYDSRTLRKFTPKPFTHVIFVHGYGDDRPRVEKEIENITIGKPRKGWCPDEFLNKEYFIIKFK